VSKFGDSPENRLAGERAVILRGDEDAEGLPGLGHLIVKPEGAVVSEHLHPHMQERFRVISGSLGARIAGEDRTLAPGDDVTDHQPGGLDWGQVEALVGALAANPALTGVSVADFVPRLDREGRCAARLADLLARML
jgi:hypothetical protein